MSDQVNMTSNEPDDRFTGCERRCLFGMSDLRLFTNSLIDHVISTTNTWL